MMKRQEFRRKKYGICRIKKTDYCRNNRSESIRRAVCIWKGNRLQVTPNYAEGSLNADDAQVEYDKEFNYAEVTLNTSTIPIEAHEEMFGHKVNEGKTGATFNKDDQAKYVGMGWISVEKVDGVRKFIGNVLYKVKFSEPSEDYSTKGDSIEYKTPSITGRAIANEDGDWKDFEAFDASEDALKWINTKFGKVEGL